jgi:hypothetical protein
MNSVKWPGAVSHTDQFSEMAIFIFGENRDCSRDSEHRLLQPNQALQPNDLEHDALG